MIKFPKIKHVPNSPGISRDDKVIRSLNCFKDKEWVISEKMDGSNVTIQGDKIIARSLSSEPIHPSYNLIKQFHKNNLEFFKNAEHLSFVFENMVATHSVKYYKICPYYLLMIYSDNGKVLSYNEMFGFIAYLNIRRPWEYFHGYDIPKYIERFHKDKTEGFVIRNKDSFNINDFDNNIFKYVRANHVQPEQDRWEKSWQKQNLIPYDNALNEQWRNNVESILMETM